MGKRKEPEVLIVGAGPVGLLAALLLERREVRVAIVDQDRRTSQHSYALAIHPRTLRLLDEVGLAGPLVGRGRTLSRIAFYEGATRQVDMDLSELKGTYPFVLLLRQSVLERAIEEELKRRRVRVLWNHRLESLREEGEGAVARIAELDQMAMGYPIQRTEWVVVGSFEWRPKFVVGADGHDSAVRRMSGIRTADLGGGTMVSVFEIQAEGDLPQEARVVLDPDRIHVYWPLEPGRCRCGFGIGSAAEHEASLERLAELLRERMPWFSARPTEIYWSTCAVFERRLAERFGRGSAWLAGDAAHLATPVGVQSMNAGLQEARDLSERIVAVLRGRAPRASLDEYDAAARAQWSLLVGHEEGIRGLPGVDPWVLRNRSRVLACTPASGDDLEPLLKQVGLSVQP